MMNKALYVFVDSARPDVYLNVIMHCVHSVGVRSVKFLHIQGLPDQDKASGEALSRRVSRNVMTLLTSLANDGEYVQFGDDDKGQGEESAPWSYVSLVDEYGAGEMKDLKAFYAQFFSSTITYGPEDDLDYKALQGWFRSVAFEGDGAIIDISAIKKRYVGDVVAAAIVEGVTGVYTLEVRQGFTWAQPWKMLLHDLRRNKTSDGNERYEHVNILDTEIYRNCTRTILLRAPQLKVALLATTLLMFATGVATAFSEDDSTWIRIFSSVSSVASLVALILVFLPPKKS